MGIKAQFTREDVEKRFKAFLNEIERQQIRNLQKLGEMCITHARNLTVEQGSFNDISGNLRSSIGYMVFRNGVAVHAFYEPTEIPAGTIKVPRKRKTKDGKIKTYMATVKVGGDGMRGAEAGEALAKKIGQEHPNGVCLVVTAGMNYAVHVEKNGRDVITSAEHLAERELPIMLEKLIDNIKRAVE